jgi:hypothetical protein
MRRALALLLLAVIGLPLISPTLLANPRSELPACCRRDGSHHCAMAAVVDEASPATPAIGGLQPKCPFSPKPGVLPVDSRTGVVAVGSRTVPTDSIQFQIADPNCGLPRIGARDAKQKRGPPPTLS